MQHAPDTEFVVEVGYRAEGMNEPVFTTFAVEGWVPDPKGRLVPIYNDGQTFHDEHPFNTVHLRPAS